MIPFSFFPNLALVGVALFTLLLDTGFATEPTVTATVSSKRVRVAEPLTIEVTVQADAETKVTFPSGQKKMGEFDIRDTEDQFDIPSAQNPSQRTWTRTFTLESITTGELPIPPIQVQVSEQGESSLLATDPVSIDVVSVLEDRSDPTKFRDIQSVVDVPVPESESHASLLWTAGAAGLIVLALTIGLTVYRHRQWTTPGKWAEEQLDALAVNAEDAPEQLSRIVREFLILQFEIPETGRTPDEIVERLVVQDQIDVSLAEQLSSLFAIADQAKFAGFTQSEEAVQTTIADTRHLITEITSRS